jgi:hypothetical protein
LSQLHYWPFRAISGWAARVGMSLNFQERRSSSFVYADIDSLTTTCIRRSYICDFIGYILNLTFVF